MKGLDLGEEEPITCVTRRDTFCDTAHGNLATESDVMACWYLASRRVRAKIRGGRGDVRQGERARRDSMIIHNANVAPCEWKLFFKIVSLSVPYNSTVTSILPKVIPTRILGGLRSACAGSGSSE